MSSECHPIHPVVARTVMYSKLILGWLYPSNIITFRWICASPNISTNIVQIHSFLKGFLALPTRRQFLSGSSVTSIQRIALLLRLWSGVKQLTVHWPCIGVLSRNLRFDVEQKHGCAPNQREGSGTDKSALDSRVKKLEPHKTRLCSSTAALNHHGSASQAAMFQKRIQSTPRPRLLMHGWYPSALNTAQV